MIQNFQGMARRLVAQLEREGIRNKPVLEVIEKTPRHLFMPQSLAHKDIRKHSATDWQGTNDFAATDGCVDDPATDAA